MVEYLEDNIVQAVKSTVDLPNIRELTGQQTLHHALELTQQLLTDFHLIHLTWLLLKPTIQEQGINSWITFTDGALPKTRKYVIKFLRTSKKFQNNLISFKLVK